VVDDAAVVAADAAGDERLADADGEGDEMIAPLERERLAGQAGEKEPVATPSRL
jgi:hypothetical protein